MDTDLPRKRRSHSPEFKSRLVREISEPCVSAAEVARRYDLNHNQIFKWRREMAAIAALPTRLGFLPVRCAPVAEMSTPAADVPLPPIPDPDPRRPLARGSLQIHLANGHHLECDGSDRSLLDHLLDRLLAS